MALKLHTIIASTRPGRIGPKVAAWFHSAAAAHGGFDCELVDLADFALPVFDEPHHPRLRRYERAHTKAWSDSVAAADAFAFVFPEYNYFVSPSLVNAIDYLSGEWARKPAGLVSYGGMSGGLRAAQSLRLLLAGVKVMPLPEAVAIPFVGQSVGEDGVFRPTDAVAATVAPMLDELRLWAEALKPLRES